MRVHCEGRTENGLVYAQDASAPQPEQGRLTNRKPDADHPGDRTRRIAADAEICYEIRSGDCRRKRLARTHP
jgi:hypothetical protein